MVRKFATLLVAFISISLSTAAQSAEDSISIANIKWNKVKLKKGVIWKSAQINLYNSPQSINIIEVKSPQKHHINIAYCTDTLLPTSTLCKKVDALAGVNASFFDMKNGNSVDYMRVDGKEVHKGRAGASHANAAFVIDGKELQILKQAADTLWAQRLTGTSILVAGPMLVVDGIAEQMQATSFNTTRHPRSGAAVMKNGSLLLITVDGRSEGNAEGMSTTELAYLLKILGAKDAMNFDGGGSTALYVKDKGEKGIVNYPSDNKQFDHLGERRVANAIYLK